MSKPIRVQGGGQGACPACGKLCGARGGVLLHYRHSPQCLPTVSDAVGIGCQERRSNVPLGTQHKPADSSIHDSDEADYPKADDEVSDLDMISPEVLVPMGDDCAAIDHGNSQLAVASQHGVIESLKVKYQAYLNSGFGQAKISKELKTKTDLLVMLQKACAPHYLYQDIWKWAQKASDTKVEFSGAGTRASVITELNRRYDLDDTKPTTISLTLPSSREVVHITTHDFLAQLRSLLSAPVLMGGKISFLVMMAIPLLNQLH